MRKSTRASNVVRFTLIVTAFLLPTLSLVPLGGLYLLEHGWLLWWTFGAFLTTSIIAAIQRWVLVDVVVQHDAPSASEAGSASPDPSWNALEEKAWLDVQAITSRVTADAVGDPQALLDLGHTTINAVARRLHPNKDDAIWQFTLPEALLIAERVSGRMNAFVSENIPFGDRLTVSQFLAMYRWKGVIDVAERGYNIWRIIRLANPAAAATNEARERLSRAIFQWGREQVTRRFAVAAVEEVGRAAIDLYGGRLKPGLGPDMSSERLFRSNFDAFAKSPILPIHVLIVGGSPQTRDWVKSQVLDGQRRQSGSNGTGVFTGAEMAVFADADLAKFSMDEMFKSPDLKNTDVVWAILPTALPLDDDLTDFLKRLNLATAETAGLLPPILMPVILLGSTSEGTSRPSGSRQSTLLTNIGTAIASLYSGSVAQPVVVDPSTASGADVLWNALKSSAPQALRIQFVRHLERAKKRGGMMSSLGQAASAVGGLAKWAIWPK